MKSLGETNTDDPFADPFLWLESIDSDDSRAWVGEQNNHTQDRLTKDPGFEELYVRNLEILDSNERIAEPILCGDTVYNLWTDAENERGLLRRQPLSTFLERAENWKAVLSIDELARTEKTNWVVHEISWLKPGYDRCIIALSPDGRVERVQREFDLVNLRFVQDGFNLPLAKSKVDWIDRDHVYVGTDFGENSLTRSGFPRIVKRWKRGGPLESAATIFEGEHNDVGTWAMPFGRPEGDVHFVVRPLVAFKNRQYILEDNSVVDLGMPLDTNIRGVIKGQVIVEVRADWIVEDQLYRKGSIVSANLAELRARKISLRLITAPEHRTSINDVKITRDFVIVNRLEDLSSVLYSYEMSGDAWVGKEIDAPRTGSIKVSNANSHSNAFFYTYTNFLTPSSLYYTAEDGEQRRMWKLPDFWNSEPFTGTRFEAISKDGTNIPYTLIHRRDMASDGSNPTLLFGYGASGRSKLPAYSPEIGISWLEKGGCYVIANIRGGGEFGKDWHHSATKKKRQTTFDDFIAVAVDLIDRGFTSPDRLGITGRSAGGLLIGAAVTQRPELFTAAYCGVPLLDMKRYHRLLAGATHLSEYGDPDIDEEWNYISKYSPYHNVKPNTEYPEVFFHTSTRDGRVHPGHARKMKALMDHYGHPALFYEASEGGHAGASTNAQKAFLIALVYSFFHSKIGSNN